jgi:hypothetical protein
VATPYNQSTLDAVYMVPTAGQWTAGARDVSCSVVTRDGSDLVGSAAGSRR